jgi:CDP-diacylglycerol---glycerol-3-phosphate 3-phosphatidyltransferase
MTLWTPIDDFIYAVFLRFLPRSVHPNHITVLRFISIPFVIYFLAGGEYKIGMMLFILSAFTDALDGVLARKRKQVTEWGITFDPLADKLLVGSAVAIIVSQVLGFWFAGIMIGLELVLIFVAWYKRYIQHKKLEAGRFGKLKMVLQSVGVGFLILFVLTSVPSILTIGHIILIAAIVCAIGSIFSYNSV